MYDNPIFNVSGKGEDELRKVMAVAPMRSAIGFHQTPERFTLFWCNHQDMTPFPSSLGMTRCADLAVDWLEDVAKYPREPDHDGDNGRGWRCFTEDWGRIEPFGFGAFLAVEPYWLMYGK